MAKVDLEDAFSEVRIAPVQHLYGRPGLSLAASRYYRDCSDFLIMPIGRATPLVGSWADRTGA